MFASTRAVNQAVEALGRIWPWLAAAILLVSVMTSLFYAHFRHDVRGINATNNTPRRILDAYRDAVLERKL